MLKTIFFKYGEEIFERIFMKPWLPFTRQQFNF